VCGRDVRRWKIFRAVALVSLLPLGFWYANGGWRGVFVAAFVCGCAGVWNFNWRWPVLVDAPAMAFALASAAASIHGLWWLATGFACLAGATKETGPIFAALWAWSTVPLVGLLLVVARAVQRAGDDVLDAQNAWILAHPFKASWEWHRRFPPWAWVMSFGVGVVALSDLSWPLTVTLLVAYGQCLMATDSMRLFQWAWPMVAVATAGAVPMRWLPALAAVHLFNPFKGDGN
jgi:hypothetical protein